MQSIHSTRPIGQNLAFFLMLSYGQQVVVVGRKNILVNELQPLYVKPVPNDYFAVFLTELKKIIWLDYRPVHLARLYRRWLEPAVVNPGIDGIHMNAKQCSQFGFGEIILPQRRGDPHSP